MIGVYKITNSVNGKYYIGSSVDIHKRLISHKCYMNKQKHHNIYLQNAYNKYGFNVFDFEVLEQCTAENIITREQFWIDKLWNKKLIYNLFRTAYSVSGKNHHMFGKNHTQESRLKIKEARAKQIISHSPETRAKIARFGRKMLPGHLEKMIAARICPVWNKGIKTGISPKNKIKFSDDYKLSIINMYSVGNSIEQIRKSQNLSWDTIKQILIDGGIITRSISQQKQYARNRKTIVVK